MKKLKIILPCFISLLAACDKSAESNPTYVYQFANDPKQNQEQQLDQNKLAQEFWKVTTDYTQPNFSVLEAFEVYFRTNDDLSVSENQHRLAIAELQRVSQKIAVGDQASLAQSLYENSIVSNPENAVFEKKLRTSYSIKRQNYFLEQINKIMSESIDKSARLLAKYYIQDLISKNSGLIDGIDSARTMLSKKRAEEILRILKQKNGELALYGFSPEDNTDLLVYSMIASVLADHLEKNMSIRTLVSVTESLRNLKDEVGNLKALLAASDDMRKKTKENLNAVRDNFQGLVNDIQFYAHNFDGDQLRLTDASKKELKQYFQDLINGTVRSDVNLREPKSFLSSEYPVNEHFIGFLDATQKSANSLGNLIQTSEKMANMLQIKLDPSVHKALMDAKKFSDDLKLANAVVDGFSQGGLIGGLSAFMSSGAGAATILSGPVAGPMMLMQAQMNSQFDAVKKDLGEIKEMQKQILDMQKKTMEMIRNVAEMIDNYHRLEMFELAEIKREVLNTKTMVSHLRNENIVQCLNTLQYLSGENSQKAPNLASVESYRQYIRNAVPDLNSLRNRLVVSGNGTVDACQNAFARTFGADITGEKSFLYAQNTASFYNSYEEDRLNLLIPALHYMQSQKINSLIQWPRRGFHLLSGTFDKFEKFKKNLLYTNFATNTQGDDVQIKNLINVPMLETVATSMLILHPYVSVGIENLRSQQDLLKILSPDSSSFVVPSEKSKKWISDAIDIARLALSQQAILSGEVLLPSLYQDYKEIISVTSKCEKLADESSSEKQEFCFIRQNPIMMKNLIRYYLWKNNHKAVVYSGAKQSQDRSTIAQVLGVGTERIQEIRTEKSTELRLVVIEKSSQTNAVSIVLPEFNQNQAAIVQTEEAQVLVKLYALLTQESAKLAPFEFTAESAASIAKILNMERH